jgi:uncharacterized protein
MTIELRQVRATPGRQIVEGYGPGGFRVSGAAFAGSVLILPDRTIDWAVGTMAELSAEAFAAVAGRDDVEILLLGTGARMAPVPSAIRLALKRAGIVIEPMDTGAACRTYNVLVAEDRRVAAALLKPA